MVLLAGMLAVWQRKVCKRRIFTLSRKSEFPEPSSCSLTRSMLVVSPVLPEVWVPAACVGKKGKATSPWEAGRAG